MHIGISIGKLDPRQGGAEAWTMSLAEWLTARGHEVHLFGFKAAAGISLSSECVHLVAPGMKRLELAMEVSNAIDRFDFDIVHDMGISLRSDVFQSHFGSIHALQAAKQRSRNRAQSILRRLAVGFSRRQEMIEQLVVKQFSQRSTTFVAVSEMVARDLSQLESIPTDRIRLVKNGVDITKFSPLRRAMLRDESRARFGVQPQELVVSILAHNHTLKGVKYAVSAIRQLSENTRPFHLLIAGGHRQKYRKMRFGRNVVQYVGSLNDPFPLLAATDIYLHPTFYDACCLSVLEAAACGLPIITTKTNGASERFVHAKSAFIINDSRDVGAICRYLRILQDPEERMVMGYLARDTAETWTHYDNFAAIEALYSDIRRSRLEAKLRSRSTIREVA
jgi:UDP-glucose:(heptosyl)LPS alpha-1,3-glucosyltransferase